MARLGFSRIGPNGRGMADSAIAHLDETGWVSRWLA